MTIEQKLEKKINTIVQLTGEYPKEIEITKQEQEQLESTQSVEFSNKDGQVLRKFRGIELKIV